MTLKDEIGIEIDDT